VDRIEEQVAAGGVAANQAKRAVARAIVALYHGADAAAAAEERFDAVFKRGETPTDVPEFTLPPGDPVHVPAVLVAAGLAASTSAARRDVDGGAVRIDGRPLSARQYDVARADLVGRVLASGKRKAVRLVETA
jgi:tyrosyl-tRNA synthetase